MKPNLKKLKPRPMNSQKPVPIERRPNLKTLNKIISGANHDWVVSQRRS